MIWEDVGFIKRGKQRLLVLRVLNGTQPSTPTEILESVDSALSNVSRTLQDLRKHDLVEVLNPESSRGRIYQITDRGREALAKVEELEEQRKKGVKMP